MNCFILVIRNTRYFLIGPFASQTAAGEWATRYNEPSNGGTDDPRWQTIVLADPDARPLVLAPVVAIHHFQSPQP